MNAQEIYNKRIKEAARECNYQYEKEELAFISGGNYALKNQWISVEEALPPKEDNGSSITVLVHCQKGWCGIDYYRYKYGEWLNNGNDVTHWMPIPQLKGGE